MDKIAHLFSLIFFITSTTYIAFGIYIIQKSYKSRLNKIFFAICISLSLWSIGFSFGVNARDIADCIFWRRIAALGWCILYSLMLHFFIIMTKNKIFRHKWLIALIYLPAAVSVYIFALSTDMVLLQYNFARTPYGWVNIAENNVWDQFFNLYFISYIFICLGLIWRWGKNSSREKYKKEARVLIAAIFVAFLLGSVTDILFNSYLEMTSSQIAPVISLIPITAIFISMRRYGLMSTRTINQDETILTDVTRLRIINYLTLVLIAGGFLSIISRHYIYGAELIEALKFSAIFIVLGVLIQITQRLRLTENTKDNLLLVLVSFLVVFVTFFFINTASITVWAFPFVLLIIFIVFNKRKMLVVLALTTLLTQLIVWIIVPDIIVRVEGSDHVVRMGLFVLGCWVAIFVNKIYVLRLRENADQIRAQKLVSEISSEFVNANILTIEEKIKSMLNRVGAFFEIDQICVFSLDEDTNTISCEYEWVNEGMIKHLEDLRNISLNASPWWMSQVNSKEPIHIPVVVELPKEAREEMQRMTDPQVQSLLAIPMSKGEKVRGFLRLDSIKSLKKWNNEHISIIRIIANVVSDALTKVEAEEKQNYMAYFDQLTGLPNRMLFKDRANQAIQLMKRTDNIEVHPKC